MPSASGSAFWKTQNRTQKRNLSQAHVEIWNELNVREKKINKK
jgi:hypothetical protein